jgi:Winged helix-turn helix
MPPPTLRVTLDQAAQAEVARRYHTTRDAEIRTRYQMVLLNAEGHTAGQIAMLTRRSPDTVRRVLKRYLAGGPDAVPHRPHPGQPPHYTPPGRPSWSGSPTATPMRSGSTALWTCRLLADYLRAVTGHRAGDRDRAGGAAPGRVCLQAAPLGAVTQGHQPAGVGNKRPRVEALLAAAAPVPPPACDLIPDATMAEDLFPEDLPRLLELLAHADLYLQDEVEVALRPTLTRGVVPGRPRRAAAGPGPGTNAKQDGFGLVDWRDGHLTGGSPRGGAPCRRALPLAWAHRHVDLG